MKIIVKGKGCARCPFLYDAEYPDISCDAAEYEGSSKRTTEANWSIRPKDCPFENNESIEVVLEKTE